jgi:choline dehydrogenase-like flavoprotein
MGIEVVLDLPGVGENYHDHPASPMHMETDNSTSYGWSWKTVPRELCCALQYALTRTGPLAGNVFEASPSCAPTRASTGPTCSSCSSRPSG